MFFDIENVLYCAVLMQYDYKRGLDWWPVLLDSVAQRVTTLYTSLLHTHYSIHSHVFTTVAL
jgi:hypothetical protein